MLSICFLNFCVFSPVSQQHSHDLFEFYALFYDTLHTCADEYKGYKRTLPGEPVAGFGKALDVVRYCFLDSVRQSTRLSYDERGHLCHPPSLTRGPTPTEEELACLDCMS